MAKPQINDHLSSLEIETSRAAYIPGSSSEWQLLLNDKALTNVITPQALGRVAVLMGGLSAEREISLLSGKAVLQALLNCNVDAFGLEVNSDIAEHLINENFDRAFVILHGENGEDGVIQAVLDTLGIPYTGSGVLASALTMDKQRCKLMWQGMGLPTLKFLMIAHDDNIDAIVSALGIPFVVKPTDQGSSQGVSIVRNKDQYKQAYQGARAYSSAVMAEVYAGKGDYTVGILGNTALPPIKIEPAHEFYDYQAKYFVDTTRYLCPGDLDPDKVAVLQALALQAFKGSGGKHWGRVDFVRDAKDQFYLLEINTIPGMTEHSLLPQMAQAVDIEFDELVLRIVAQTLN